MSKKECQVGCKTHFKEGEKLPLQGLSIELKNYPFPIQDSKHRWNLLKTICSLLNSKGGTIFIGAEDKTGEVRGIKCQRKELDDFKIFIQQLTERIQPAVDLSHKEEILVQFIPILKSQSFTGKYLIKIVVQQGKPSDLYCFTQRIQLQSAQDRKTEEYEIVYSYIRLNTGNIKEFKGYELVKEAARKSSDPPKKVEAHHEGCNPEPSNLSLEILKIGFKNLYNRKTYYKLEKWLTQFFDERGLVSSLISYDKENDMLVMEFESLILFQKALAELEKSTGKLQQAFPAFNFLKKQHFLDCILFENLNQESKQPKNHKEPKEAAKVEKITPSPKKEAKMEENQEDWEDEDEEDDEDDSNNSQWEDQSSESQKMEERETDIIIPQKNKVVERGDVKKKINMPVKSQKIPPPLVPQKSYLKANCLTITHINPKKDEELVNFIEGLCPCKKEIRKYVNTVEIFFNDRDDFNNYVKIVKKRYNEFKEFGYNEIIKIGVNRKEIEIKNYDNKKYRELQSYLVGQIGEDLKVCRSQKQGATYSLILEFKNCSQSCIWLDNLLKMKKMWDFRIPGAEKGQKARMKYYLLCDFIKN